MSEITKKTDNVIGYGCDLCGEIVSDNKPDGCGGINWWGLCVDLEHRANIQEITITQHWIDSYNVRFRTPGINGFDRLKDYKSYLVCSSCAKKIREFIESIKVIDREKK
jgi:hypothetical protein